MGDGLTGWRLAVRSLACERGARRLLTDVDFTLGPGEVAILRGPNGAGKTTLLRVLAGLAEPAEGRAAWIEEGGDPADPPRLVSRVAYLGHRDAVKAGQTVRANLRFWASIEGADAEAVDRALGAVGLSALHDLHALALSAGQRRRLGFARLLLKPRPLWVLDEPLTGLDAAWRKRFAGLIDDHRKAGRAALIATHDAMGLDEVRDIRIEKGRLAA